MGSEVQGSLTIQDAPKEARTPVLCDLLVEFRCLSHSSTEEDKLEGGRQERHEEGKH